MRVIGTHSTYDFETEAIQKYPDYPPKPVGVAIRMKGEKQVSYCAWGHQTNNGIYQLKNRKIVKLEGDPKARANMLLKEAFKGKILGHNSSKFDVAVAKKHMALKAPGWQNQDDTLFSLFLKDPHAKSLSLKDQAEARLGEKPTERDALYAWLAQHGYIRGAQLKDGVLKYPKEAGAFICKAPGDMAALYAIGDVTRTDGLWEKVQSSIVEDGMKAAYDRERQLAPILLENEQQGMRVDMPALYRDVPIYLKALTKVQDWLRKKLKAPTTLNWDSDEEVARALHKAGIVKNFPKTPTGKDSVSKKNLTLEYFNEPRVFAAMVYRSNLSEVLKKNMIPWLDMGEKTGGFIFTQWNQVRSEKDKGGARSGRVTCTWFANIVKAHVDKGSDEYSSVMDIDIRAFIGLPELPLSRFYCLADAGELFVHQDFNQQELRLVAHYEEGALAQAYRDDPGTDIHQYVTELIHKITRHLWDRKWIKTINFRTVYGGGVAGLAAMMRVPFHEAKAMVDGWKAALPDVGSLDRELKERFYEGKALRTYGGRLYHCKPPALMKKGSRKGQMVSFEYTALNYLIQPSGADVTKEAIIRYHDHPKRRGRMLATVYDEINLSAPKALAKAESDVLKECMESVKLDVPWMTKGKIGTSWGNAA